MLGRWQRKNDALHSQRGSRPFFTPNKASIEKASKGSFNNYVGGWGGSKTQLKKNPFAFYYALDLIDQNFLCLPFFFMSDRHGCASKIKISED